MRSSRPPREKSESDIEAEAVKRARQKGYLCHKVVFVDARGGPDRWFAKPGRTVWIEMKRPGKTPTEQQELRHQEMRDAGQEVHWADSWEQVLVILV